MLNDKIQTVLLHAVSSTQQLNKELLFKYSPDHC